jgi:hypothetical protein
MTVTKRGIPTYEQPLTVGANMSSSWRRWFHDIEVGTPPSNEVRVTVTGSPFAFQAPSRGAVIVNGGTVSQIQFSRTTGINYVTGQTSGMFSMSLGDVLTVTYSGLPSMIFVPS